jgi:ABC-type phosphate transport system substrate-binding protein
MSQYIRVLAGSVAAVMAMGAAVTSTYGQTTALYGGGSTLVEKIDRIIFNQYGSTANGDTCAGLPSSYCAATPYRNDVEPLYVGVGSGNGKNSLTHHDAALYVSGNRTPDDPPVASTRDFGPFYGTGTGTSWSPGTTNPFPKVSFSASDDPLTAADISTYNALPTTFGPLVQVPGQVATVAVAFTPTPGWKPKGPILQSDGKRYGSKVNLSTNTVCGIFTGAITDWSNAEITKDNYGTQLGKGTITVVYRHDGSGTTFLFTNGLVNQCGTTSHPVSTHPVPDQWLTDNGMSFSITAPHFTSQNAFFINVFNAGHLPANFYNDTGGFSGVTGGCNGNGGVQLCVDKTAGAIAYISPNFIQPFTTGNDENGSPVAASANIQTYYSYFYHLTPVFLPPAPSHGTFIMQYTQPPIFVGNATAPATNPLNWGAVDPTPLFAGAYPFGGFTFIDFYSCYASKKDVDALMGVVPHKLGLFRWFFGSQPENGNIPKNALVANGFSPIPVTWLGAVQKLLFLNQNTRIGTPGQSGTACANVSHGA